MTHRRERPSQVRLRPPSTGRPRQLPPAPRRPVVPRGVAARHPEPGRGMPLAARVVLVVAIVALAAVVTTTVTGVLPRVVAAIGTALGGITDTVLATPVPSQSLAPIPAAPVLASPDSPYTNKPAATLAGTVPLEAVGRGGFVIRIYVALPDLEPVLVREAAVGETPSFIVEDITLEPGRNDITATLAGPGGESESSPVITYVLDTSKPKITVTSPKNRATVNGAVVKITGKTQGRSTVVARNEANGTAATAAAASNGTFTLELPLRAGSNAIALTATDLAGNVGTAVLTVRHGSGALNIVLNPSASRVSAARLPAWIELRAVVTDPNARPLAGQLVTFTLSVPGVPVITGEETTDGSGRATFRTLIPAGATEGPGLGTADVSTSEHGSDSATTVVMIVK